MTILAKMPLMMMLIRNEPFMNMYSEPDPGTDVELDEEEDHE